MRLVITWTSSGPGTPLLMHVATSEGCTATHTFPNGLPESGAVQVPFVIDPSTTLSDAELLAALERRLSSRRDQIVTLEAEAADRRGE